MVICGSYMSEFSVSNNMKKQKNNDKRRIHKKGGGYIYF